MPCSCRTAAAAPSRPSARRLAPVSRQANAYPVIWYVGQTVDNGRVVEVMFEISGPNGRQLVVGQATASDVMKNQAAWSNATSPWALTEVPAPDPAKAPLAIGDYVP